MAHNDSTASNDKEKAQLFNDYFYSVFSVDANLPAMASITIEDVVIAEPDVLDLLQLLDVNEASTISVPKYSDSVPYLYSNLYVIYSL